MDGVPESLAPEATVVAGGALDEVDHAALSVVAVVVAHDPGDWFGETLRSLTDQDHPLTTLVVDAASSDHQCLANEVAAVVPEAHLRRLDVVDSYGAATNEVLDLVDGADYYLLLHDDVALAPDTVSTLVSAAQRFDAGVAGPKFVHWDDPRRLLDAGSTMDGTGHPMSLIEPGDLDVGQHDGVRDVAVLGGGCVLVRADLFADLGGFDDGISYLGETVDLCWRARAAGSTVVVVPDAVVRHRQALGSRRSADDRRALAARHRLRSMLIATGPLGLVVAIPAAALITVVEALAVLVAGRFAHAADIVGAWMWNGRRLGEIRRRRVLLSRARAATDRELATLHVRGSARLLLALRGQIGGASRGQLLGSDQGVARAGPPFAPFAIAVLGLLVVVGSRHLLAGVPSVGTIPALAGLGDGIRDALDPWRDQGLGTLAPSPPGLMVLAGVRLAALLTPLTDSAVVLLPLLAAAGGTWRLVRPAAGLPGGVAAVIVVAAHPATTGALAGGDWAALVAIGAAPWIMAALGETGGWWSDPTEPARPPHASPDRLRRARILRMAVGLAVVGALVPPIAVLPLVVVAGGAMGGWLVGPGPRAGRGFTVALGGTVGAILLTAPWSLSFVWPGAHWSPLAGVERPVVDVADLFTGHVGGVDPGWVGGGWIVAAAVVLIIGRGTRLTGGFRAWGVLLAAVGLAHAAARGWTWVALSPTVAGALVPPALAVAVGLGVAAVIVDVGRIRLGARQVAMLVGLVGFAMAITPWVRVLPDGRWGLPARGQVETLDRLVEEPPGDAGRRIVWIGDSDVIPVGGWRLTDGVALGTTTGRLADSRDLFAPASPGSAGALLEAVRLAIGGSTTQLGRLLAPMGVRFLVVVHQGGPVGSNALQRPAPTSLLDGLDRQLDLSRTETDGTAVVYENDAAIRVDIEAPEGEAALDRRRPVGFRLAFVLLPALVWTAAVVGLWRLRGVRR